MFFFLEQLGIWNLMEFECVFFSSLDFKTKTEEDKTDGAYFFFVDGNMACSGEAGLPYVDVRIPSKQHERGLELLHKV